MSTVNIHSHNSVNQSALREFCHTEHIQRLSLFGSVLREDFNSSSDIDVLLVFESGHTPGFLGLARIERMLSGMFGGKKIDVRTPDELSRYFRDEVVSSAQVLYVA